MINLGLHRHGFWRRRCAGAGAVLLIGLAGLARSGLAAGMSGEYLIDVWDREAGLPNSTVTAVAQTPDGYLWVGTHNGLARFDGLRFATFEPGSTPELKHARVVGLFVDGQGTLWINTYDGSLTSWRNGRFAHEWRGWEGAQVAQVFSRSNQTVFATLTGQLALRDGAADSTGVWRTLQPAGRTTGASFHEDARGVLWYNTRDGLVGRVAGTNSETLLPGACGLGSQRVNCLTADRAGRIWAGTDQGIWRWEGTRFEPHTPTNGEMKVSFLFCGRDGSGWAVADNRLRRFSGGRWLGEAGEWGGLFNSAMPAFGAYEDRRGGVWFRHYGQGVFRAREDGGLRRISSEDGLPGERITCWLEDREGSVWVGVDRGGLVRLREKRFDVIGVAEGLGAQGTVSVCEDAQGTIWIGSYGGGLNRWEHGRLTRFLLPEGASKGFFFCGYPGSEGRLWLSAGREDLYAQQEGRITAAPVNVHGIKAMLVDRQGRLWMGRNRGISCWTNGALEAFGPSAGLDNTDIHALAQDAGGDIWAGGGNGVLYRYQAGRFTAFKVEDKLGQQAIWSLLPDEDGTLWAGTFRGGLLRFKGGKFTRFTTENGLPSDVICQILDDGTGNLWVGSHKGIFHVAKNALHALAAGAPGVLPCVTYGLYDGLPTLECSGGYQPSAWRGRDGRLWFATFKGVVSIRPDNLPSNRLAPPVVLEEVLVDGKPAGEGTEPSSPGWETAGGAGPAPTFRAPGAVLRVGPGKSQVEFRYTAPSFVAADKVGFRYKLEGLDQDWVNAADRRLAQYSHLRPGNYRFRVTACNNDGVWNPTDAAVSLEVLPQFWETWWFLSGMSVVLLGGLVGTVRFAATRNLRRKLERLEQQRAVERDRARIAKDIHDDLGAGLTQILLQSSLARRELKQQEQSNLLQISQTAQDLIRGMDEIVWAVNPQNDTLEGLGSYISKFAHDYLTAAGVRCRLELPEQLPPRLVSSEARHNLFLTIKEALNNVLKHSGATEVWLRMALQPSGFSIVIQDNGRGFNPGNISSNSGAGREGNRIESGHGLGNMARRLQAIGGEFIIRSAPGKGATVEMRLP